VDNGDLTLIDVSAAFDTVDLVTLLHRLEASYDISGTVHTWFASYLGGRWQYVRSGQTYEVGAYRRALWCPASVGRWSDPFSAVYCKPARANRDIRVMATYLC